MKDKTHIAIIVGALAAIILLIVAYPDWMISPGRLKPAHAHLARNCLACHSLFQGVSSEKCLSCHKIESDGVIATKDAPLRDRKRPTPFHHQLTEKNCLACHSGAHEGRD